MKSSHIYTLFLMLLICTSCGQSRTDLTKENIKSEIRDLNTSQVPNSMVRNVRQDRNGNILIASYKGVFRHDPKYVVGKLFTNITSAISSPSFWDVLEDRKGNLWLATRDSGVYYYSARLNDKVKQDKSPASGQGGFQHFTTKEGLASNAVMSIYEDKAGIIWFGTAGGVSRYDPGQAVGNSFQNFTTKDGLPDNGITTIMEDRNGKLWIGTRGEACFYDGETFTVFRNKDGKAFNNVWGITKDRKGNIWFGATIIEKRKGNRLIVTAGLWRYDGSAFTKINQRGTSAIIEDKKGNIWTTGSVNPNGVGAWKLLRYDQKSLYSKNPVITEIMSTEKMLCGILEANDGSIWFGSMNGVYRYDGKNFTDFKSKEEQR